MQPITITQINGNVVTLKPGTTHVHFKGGQYRLLARAFEESSSQAVVVYEHIASAPGMLANPIGKVWVRPAAEFDGRVNVTPPTANRMITAPRFEDVRHLNTRHHGSIMQDWAAALPLRHQGCLVAAVRGCDGMSKHCNAKPLVRFLRWAFMHPFDVREVGVTNAFFADTLPPEDRITFLKDWDQYPMHFLQHLMHAYEVVGYKHPDYSTRAMAHEVYIGIVFKLHLWPEAEVTMDERLTEDRIASGNVVS